MKGNNSHNGVPNDIPNDIPNQNGSVPPNVMNQMNKLITDIATHEVAFYTLIKTFEEKNTMNVVLYNNTNKDQPIFYKLNENYNDGPNDYFECFLVTCSKNILVWGNFSIGYLDLDSNPPVIKIRTDQTHPFKIILPNQNQTEFNLKLKDCNKVLEQIIRNTPVYEIDSNFNILNTYPSNTFSFNQYDTIDRDDFFEVEEYVDNENIVEIEEYDENDVHIQRLAPIRMQNYRDLLPNIDDSYGSDDSDDEKNSLLNEIENDPQVIEQNRLIQLEQLDQLRNVYNPEDHYDFSLIQQLDEIQQFNEMDDLDIKYIENQLPEINMSEDTNDEPNYPDYPNYSDDDSIDWDNLHLDDDDDFSINQDNLDEINQWFNDKDMK